MMTKGFIKTFLLIILCIVVLIVLVAIPFVLKAKGEGETMVAAYQKATEEVFKKEGIELEPVVVKPEFQIINPPKALKLIKMIPSRAKTGKFSTITSMDATMFGFMKMYTLLLAPKTGYNFPILSFDVVSVGKNRVLVIEVIDPSHVPADYITSTYEKMKALKEKVKDLPDTPPDMPWAKEVTMPFSIHTKADRSKEEFFRDLYREYLTTYLEMVKNAPQLTDEEQSKKVQEGIKTYVNTLLEKGGPAVNVFKFLLGPEKQKEFTKGIMFGIEE
jgi:flagellar basal body-associated protein FliL